jgi:competence protein ComGC
MDTFGIIISIIVISFPVQLLYYLLRKKEDGEKEGTGLLIPAGILSALIIIILVPNYLRAKTCGQYTYCQSNLKTIATALETYSLDHDGEYPSNMEDLVPAYIPEIPSCPVGDGLKLGYVVFIRTTGGNTYIPSYQVYNDTLSKEFRYTYYCSGENHKVFTDPNFPQYNSENGLIIR